MKLRVQFLCQRILDPKSILTTTTRQQRCARGRPLTHAYPADTQLRVGHSYRTMKPAETSGDNENALLSSLKQSASLVPLNMHKCHFLIKKNRWKFVKSRGELGGRSE